MTKRALLSVYDKTGIVEFGGKLSELGWGVLSSGGTAKALREAGIPVMDTAGYTGFPAILGHRVVTLHPKIHGGILANLDDASHRGDLEKYGIEEISLVVGNLYPFDEKPSVEMIDIGGPAMVRAAAKNCSRVGVVTDPSEYDGVLAELEADGELSEKTRKRLARNAFAHTAAYDAAIVEWMDGEGGDGGVSEEFPEELTLRYEKNLSLRYGENPHQKAAYYAAVGEKHLLSGVDKLQGKDLSFNNLYDVDAARNLLSEFEDAPAAVIIKHANPCGAAVGETLAEAYEKALASDPISAFGGIVALNGEVGGELAGKISKIFTEVLIAPSFTAEARETFASKPNAVLLEAGVVPKAPFASKPVAGGVLLQNSDETEDSSEYETVTESKPSESQMSDLLFAWRVAKRVKSNAIVLVKDGATVGVGAGQMSRVDSSGIAMKKAGDRVNGSVAASDAFFPFADGVEILAEAGISAVIQPGGSKRDGEVIEAANRYGISMVFTGRRHFLH